MDAPTTCPLCREEIARYNDDPWMDLAAHVDWHAMNMGLPITGTNTWVCPCEYGYDYRKGQSIFSGLRRLAQHLQDRAQTEGLAEHLALALIANVGRGEQ